MKFHFANPCLLGPLKERDNHLGYEFIGLLFMFLVSLCILIDDLQAPNALFNKLIIDYGLLIIQLNWKIWINIDEGTLDHHKQELVALIVST